MASIDEPLAGLGLDPTDDNGLMDDDELVRVVGTVKLHPVSRLDVPPFEFVIKLFSIGLLAIKLLLGVDDKVGDEDEDKEGDDDDGEDEITHDAEVGVDEDVVPEVIVI